MRRIKVEQSAKETYTAHPGLALVGRCIGLCRDMREQVGRLERGRHGLSSMDILTCFLGLLCLGRSDLRGGRRPARGRLVQGGVGA